MCATSAATPAPLWRPSPRRVAEANITRFMAGYRTYAELWKWSAGQPEEFWRSLVRFCGLRVSWNAWPAPTLNYAANLLRHADHAPALIAASGSAPRREMTHRELAQQVSRAEQALRAAGVAQGDHIAVFQPDVPEAVTAFLAAAAIGAVWCSCPPGLGADEAASLFKLVQPRLMITSGGEEAGSLASAESIAAQTPSIAQVLVMTSSGTNPPLASLPRALRWQDALAFYSPREIEFAELAFDQPLAVHLSPRMPVQRAGETLLHNLKELVLHTDLKSTDRILCQAACGGPVWIWQLSALAAGSCVVLYGESQQDPAGIPFWRTVELERVSIAGVTMRSLETLAGSGFKPRREFGLSALRTLVCVDGTPPEACFDYVYQEVKRDLHFAAMRPAVDSPANLELGCPVLPVYAGQAQVHGLGIAGGSCAIPPLAARPAPVPE